MLEINGDELLISRRKRDLEARLSMFPKNKLPKMKFIQQTGEEEDLRVDEKCRDEKQREYEQAANKVKAAAKQGRVTEKLSETFSVRLAEWMVWQVICIERNLDKACLKGGSNHAQIRDLGGDAIEAGSEFIEIAKRLPPDQGHCRYGLFRHAARIFRQVATIEDRYDFTKADMKKIQKPFKGGSSGGISGAAANNVANLYYWKDVNPETKDGDALYGAPGANFAVARLWLEKGVKYGDENAKRSLAGMKMRIMAAKSGIPVMDTGMDKKTGKPLGYMDLDPNAKKPTAEQEELQKKAMKAGTEALMKRKYAKKADAAARDENAGTKGEFLNVKCIVDGLVSKPHLNGEVCVPSKWNPDKGRYAVTDFGYGGLWLRPSSLIPKTDYYASNNNGGSDSDDDDDGDDDDDDDDDIIRKLQSAGLSAGGKNSRDLEYVKYF